jgi:hypothetical protein
MKRGGWPIQAGYKNKLLNLTKWKDQILEIEASEFELFLKHSSTIRSTPVGGEINSTNHFCESAEYQKMRENQFPGQKNQNFWL